MNNDYKRWRQEVEVEEEAKSPAVGKVAELEQEYKRVVWVALYTSAWIEIIHLVRVLEMHLGRTLHECVD